MTAEKVHRNIAQSIQRMAEASAVRHRSTHLGTVIGAGPYRIELHDTSAILIEGVDLLLSSWVRHYDHLYGVQLGDNALIDHRHGVYVWTDMLSDTDPIPTTLP